MIYGRLNILGYGSVDRAAFESFTKFKEARDAADALVLEVLDQVALQTGAPARLPPAAASPGNPRPLGELETWLDLKRLAAHAEGGSLPEGPRDFPDPSADPVLRPYLSGKEASNYPHLLGHAESEGVFIPLPFPRPFWLAKEQVSVGSVPGLAAELERLERIVGAHKDVFPAEVELLEKLLALCREADRGRLSIELSSKKQGVQEAH
ncbi:MAG: hypothetical protein AB1405_06630 [Bdellovibrionota bacterium]